ncbi:hypothetical protein GCM10027511_31380 [Hymenobacter humi]
MPSSTFVDPNFSHTFCPESCADPDGGACACGDTASALDDARLPAGGDADPDDVDGPLDPAGALEEAALAGAELVAAEPVAGSELEAAAEEGDTPAEVLGATVLAEPAEVGGAPVDEAD